MRVPLTELSLLQIYIPTMTMQQNNFGSFHLVADILFHLLSLFELHEQKNLFILRCTFLSVLLTFLLAFTVNSPVLSSKTSSSFELPFFATSFLKNFFILLGSVAILTAYNPISSMCYGRSNNVFVSSSL